MKKNEIRRPGRKKNAVFDPSFSQDFRQFLEQLVVLQCASPVNLKKYPEKLEKRKVFMGKFLQLDTKTISNQIFNTRKGAELSYTSLTSLINHVNTLCNDYKNAEKTFNNKELLQFLERLKKEYFNSLEKDDTSSVHENYDSPLKFLEKSSWYCYERLVNAIGRKLIRFGSIYRDEIEVTAYPPQPEIREWKGTAKLDPQQGYMIVSLINDFSKSLYTHFMITITKVQSMDICIGHMTFENPDHHNVVTKTIILKRLEEEDFSNEQKSGSILDFKNKTIPPEIVNFLINRNINRLSSPHSDGAVFTLDKLKRWNENNIIHLYGDLETYNVLQAEYYLFYMKDGKLVRDFLYINNDNHPELHAKYIHTVDNRKYTWNGITEINHESKLLIILLNGPIKDVHKKPIHNQPIFIMLGIPPKEKIWDTLIGVIAGNSDIDYGPVGRLVLIVKLINNEPPDGFDEKKIEQFFKRPENQACVNPERKVFEFKNL